MTTKYTFTDCSGIEQPLTQGYIHELLDRVHCIRDSFYSHCIEHPAEIIVRKELEECFQMMCDICQKIGEAWEP